jgi:hypothetical protein
MFFQLFISRFVSRRIRWWIADKNDDGWKNLFASPTNKTCSTSNCLVVLFFHAQGCRPNAEVLLVMSSVVATLVTFAASSLGRVDSSSCAELFVLLIISESIKKDQSNIVKRAYIIKHHYIIISREANWLWNGVLRVYSGKINLSYYSKVSLYIFF